MSERSTELTCGRCTHVLQFTGDPPRFCAYCGHALDPAATTSPVDLPSEQVTIPPTAVPETASLPPRPASGGDDDGEPETVGGYNLRRRLGGGGMGSVYEAEDPVSGRRVALKLVLPEYATSPEAVQRFRQEGRLASSLSHPRCVFVLAADEDAGRPYIVMELMPGHTLHDLVRRKGPLPPEEAVARILDVIDGLREAHRLGLVHRDVKPSNCFLESDGRVKVGDFGLAKSLVSEAKLTRTGTFLGTPLFASPEQIKMEAVDAQSDVYSVAATLYFLLAGRAPFQTGDALATLARIVSDDPPPLRTVRPELPKALDRVVLRGLQRDRKRRYRDLDEFRAALLPLLPAVPSISGTGLRLAAYLIDCFLLWAVGSLLGLAGQAIAHASGTVHLPGLGTYIVTQAAGALIFLLYFGIPEGRWGWSPAKRLLRLRVGAAGSGLPPGIGRAMLRAGSWLVLFNLGTWVVGAVMATSGVVMVPSGAGGPSLTEEQLKEFGALLLLVDVWLLLAVGLTVCTMRAANGYRALHEVLSGTRTYRLAWPRLQKRRAVQRRDFRLEVTQPDGLPEKLGGFRVRGALRWGERERALVAEDPGLGRGVWLWLRPASAPPLDAARREVSRGTRIRWVACGQDGDWQWDAFLAPAGIPLPALTAGGQRLSWADVRPILEDLAEELGASCADGTLPRCLTPAQVWVDPGGRVQLLGTPLTGDGADVAGATGDESSAGAGDQERALRFLSEVAALTLEGRPRPPDERQVPVRAPVPPHAAAMLDRLLWVRKPYEMIDQFRKDLDATRDRPTEVTRLRRAGHLALTAVLLHIPLMGPTLIPILGFACLLHFAQLAGSAVAPDEDAHLATCAFTVVIITYWVVWAFLFRGGYAFWRGGITLRRANGRKALRLQCAFRALLVWAPVGGLLCLAAAVARLAAGMPWLYFSIWGLAVALLIAYVPLALWSPTRGPHDRLAGTYLVPD
jgi:hypothetical protein